MTAPARRAEDRAIDARQAQTARAFGPHIAEQPYRAPVRLAPVAPHVHAYATERAEEAVSRKLLAWQLERDDAVRWGAVIAQGLAVLPLEADPREHVRAVLYRADQRCLLVAGQRVAPVLRAYVGALDEHARVLRGDVMCRGVSDADEIEARRSEAYAASVRERMEQ